MNVHINPVSNTRYSGKNRIALEVFMKKRNFSVPKWITFYQAKQLGRKIKKGEHGIVVFKGYTNIVTNNDKEEIKKESVPLGWAVVFNLDQTTK